MRSPLHASFNCRPGKRLGRNTRADHDDARLPPTQPPECALQFWSDGYWPLPRSRSWGCSPARSCRGLRPRGTSRIDGCSSSLRCRCSSSSTACLIRPPEVAVEDAVVDLAREAVTWTSAPRFTPVPAQAGSAVLRAVYVFNGQPSADPCADDVIGGTWQQGGRFTLIAALCDGSVMLARVDGLLKRQGGLDDPRFSRSSSLRRPAISWLRRPHPARKPGGCRLN